MATLNQLTSIVGNDVFRYRVSMGMFNVAREVLFEAPDTTNHQLRTNFAKGVIASDYSSFLKYAALVVTDPVISAANVPTNGADGITDATIIDCIRRMWNPLSGVVT